MLVSKIVVGVLVLLSVGCGTPERGLHDGTNHAEFVLTCARHRPLRDCHRDACHLYPRARACKGTD